MSFGLVIIIPTLILFTNCNRLICRFDLYYHVSYNRHSKNKEKKYQYPLLMIIQVITCLLEKSQATKSQTTLIPQPCLWNCIIISFNIVPNMNLRSSLVFHLHSNKRQR